MQHRYIEGFAGDIGLDGVLVSILANHNPLGIVAVGIFFGALRNLGFVLAQLTNVSSYAITLIFAIFILTYISEPSRQARVIGRNAWRRIIRR